MQIDQSTIIRFWNKVDKNGIKKEYMDTQCWVWTAGKTNIGYGGFYYNGKYISAHRFSWLLHYGEIPTDLFVLHKCDSRDCTNPEHLFLGTHQDNIDDEVKKGRQAKGLTHMSVIHPELVARGERSGRYTKPEKTARGDKNGSRTHPEKLKRGENNLHHKLTESQVLEIRSTYGFNKEMSSRKLAKKYGVTKKVILDIINGKTWKHLLPKEDDN